VQQLLESSAVYAIDARGYTATLAALRTVVTPFLAQSLCVSPATGDLFALAVTDESVSPSYLHWSVFYLIDSE
jgi:hypothetical protein